jgi:Leucine-rich repeat (LRR) protein
MKAIMGFASLNNATQTTDSCLSWSCLPDEIACKILSFTPEATLSMRVVSRELHRISTEFLDSNRQRLVKKYSPAISPLSSFIRRILTRFSTPPNSASHCNRIQFHLAITRELRALGIMECPDTVLSARQIHHYTIRIQEENLQKLWSRIQLQVQMAISPPWEVPEATTPAQEMRTWMAFNTHLLHTIPHLSLEETGLTFLPAETGHFINLVRLSLCNNRLREILSGTLDSLNQLQELSLGNNQMQRISSGAFDALSQLQRLYLHNNQIRELPTALFQNLKQLRLIFLQNNLLKTLPPRMFDGLNQLQQLYLDNNHLTALPTEIFHGLDQLQSLQLQHNQLHDLPPGAFDGLTRLQVLALFSNQLSSLSPTVFHPLDQLHSLSIYDNPRLLIPYHELPACQNNILFLEMIDPFFNYKCTSPFAKFYQLAAGDAPTETVKETFHTLNEPLKNAIFEGVYMEAGRPDTTDFKWGENHVFDSTQVFNGALKRVVKDKFEKMTDSQKNTLSDRVYTLASSERDTQEEHQDDPQVNTDPTHDNILRLIDAMHELQIWEL